MSGPDLGTGLSPQESKRRKAVRRRRRQDLQEAPERACWTVCIADQVANDVRAIEPSFRIIRGQEFDRAEPVFLILPVRLEIVFALAPKGRQAPS